MFDIGGTLLVTAVLAASGPSPFASRENDYAQVHMKWPMSADEAESMLANTNVFACEFIYRGGQPSPQVASFNVLLDSADALIRLDRLASGTNPVGRLYALCGYQVLSGKRYKALRQVLLALPGKADTQCGCIGDVSLIAELVRDIEHSRLGREFRRARGEIYDDLRRAG